GPQRRAQRADNLPTTVAVLLSAPAAHQWGERESVAIEGDQGRSVGDRHSQAAAAAGGSRRAGEQDGAHRLGGDAAQGAIPAGLGGLASAPTLELAREVRKRGGTGGGRTGNGRKPPRT